MINFETIYMVIYTLTILLLGYVMGISSRGGKK